MTNKEWHEQMNLLSPEMRQYVEGCIEDSEFLEYLDAHGVHTWAYYRSAQHEYLADKEQLI